MGDLLVQIGLLLIVGGILLILAYILLSILLTFKKYPKAEERREVKKGALVMIGPIPIVYATDVNIAKLMILIAILMLIALLVIIFPLLILK